MSLGVPLALAGLAALPLLWWLHRRRARPRVVVLPSLMFLRPEAEAARRPRPRRVDLELLAALLAAALLVLGAADPRLARETTGRRVRVVVSGGAPLEARGARARVDAALAALRAGLGPDDEVKVHTLPPEAGGPRPALEEVLAAAGAGAADLRLVLSDLEPPPEASGVAWVGVGDAQARNVGVVAARVEPDAAGAPVLFATLCAGPAGGLGAEVEVQAGGAAPARRALDLEAGACRSLEVPLDAAVAAVTLRVRAAGDVLAADDTVELVRDPLAVHASAALPPALRARLALALDAIAGPGGHRWVADPAAPADLAVLGEGDAAAPRARRTLRLRLEVPGAPTVALAPGPAPPGRGAAAELSAAQADWRLPARAPAPDPAEAVLLLAPTAAGPRPLLVGRGAEVRLLADPRLGAPAPLATAFWPLLLARLLEEGGGRPAGAGGWRARGLLDAPSTALGRFASPVGGLGRALPAPRPRPPLALRPFLLLGAVLALLFVWLAPWWTARAGRAGAGPARRAA